MDIDVLRLVERAQIAIEVGESHFREFKSAYEGQPDSKKPRDVKEIAYDIARTLVAFSNADGGDLYVGVEDNSLITGIDFKEKELAYLMDAPTTYVHKSTPLPSLRKAIIEIHDKKILFFSVTKGTKFVYITADGKCLQRKDMESVPISPQAIEFSWQEIESREYDRQFVDSASLSDLNIQLIERFSKDLYRISPEKFLQYLELGEFDGGSIRLKRAALLLFGIESSKWHPRCQVRVMRVNGTKLLSGKDYNVSSDNVAADSIVVLIERAWELLRPSLVETKLSDNALFKTQVMYPELACREALINAIAHRDYSMEGRGIEIYVYDDRIEFISPGELLSTIQLNDILKQTGSHQSRNTHIARTLREIGYMRELGEGIRRIFQLLNDNELAAPTISSEDSSFKITMFQKTIYSHDEQLWLDNFNSMSLTRDEKAIIRIGGRGQLLSPQDIWDVVGIIDTDYYRKLLEQLKRKGVLISQVSKNEASAISKKKHIDRKKVARFSITVPHNFPTNLQPYNDSVAEVELDDSDYAIIYISNIPYASSRDEISNLFSAYGCVESVTLPVNRETGRPKGFGFIEFLHSEDAHKLVAESPDIYLDGRKLFIKMAMPK